MEWTVLPRHPYSLNLAPFCFHPFGPWRTHSENTVLQTTSSWNATCVESSDASAEFYATGIERLTKSWKNCVVNVKDFVERLSELCEGSTQDICKCNHNCKLQFLRKIGGITFSLPSHCWIYFYDNAPIKSLETSFNETQRTATGNSAKLFNMTFYFPSSTAHNFTHPLTTAKSLTTPPSPNMMRIIVVIAIDAATYIHPLFVPC